MNMGGAVKIAAETFKRDGLAGCRDLLFACVNLLREPLKMSNLPVMVQVEPTIHCNIQCQMCVNPIMNRAKMHMSLEQFKKIVDDLPPLKKMSLVGAGEPLMNPSLFEMIAYANSKHIEIGFATNGMLLDEEMCAKVIASGARWVNISVDSASPKKYEKIRRGADFNKLIKNIRNLKILNDEENKLEISVWFVVMKDNIDDLPGVVKLAGELGIGKVFAQLEHSWSDNRIMGNMMDRRVDGFAASLKRTLRKAREEASRSRVCFDYVNVPDEEKPRACKWPWKSCYITVEGFVTPCCIQGSNPGVINFGNIFKDSFGNIWNNRGYIEFRKSLKSDTRPKICVGCTSYNKRIEI